MLIQVSLAVYEARMLHYFGSIWQFEVMKPVSIFVDFIYSVLCLLKNSY